MKVLESDAQLVEDAVRYVIFLVDADKLFDIALGMYDFTLVLLIAQHSQKVRIPISNRHSHPLLISRKDPREYLPFLRELKALDKDYQRFKIDDHLKRYTKALRNLFEGGEHGEAFDLRHAKRQQARVTLRNLAAI
jgi:elongator complex protein 1